jgi:hypothetical protein
LSNDVDVDVDVEKRPFDATTASTTAFRPSTSLGMWDTQLLQTPLGHSLLSYLKDNKHRLRCTQCYAADPLIQDERRHGDDGTTLMANNSDDDLRQRLETLAGKNAWLSESRTKGVHSLLSAIRANKTLTNDNKLWVLETCEIVDRMMEPHFVSGGAPGLGRGR